MRPLKLGTLRQRERQISTTLKTTNHGQLRAGRGPGCPITSGSTSAVIGTTSGEDHACATPTTRGEHEDDGERQPAPGCGAGPGRGPALGAGAPVGPACAGRHAGGHGRRPVLRCRGGSLYGPRPEPALAARAPEEVAADQHLGADRRCRRRGRAGRCGGRRRPRRRGRRRAAAGPSPRACARAGRCRCARCARPRPSARPGRPRSPATARRRSVLPGPQRVDPVPEQHLGAVDVADAGQDRLVHQQVADRRAGCARSAPRRGPGRRRRAAGRARAGRRPRRAGRR